jgi:hypothetical protein
MTSSIKQSLSQLREVIPQLNKAADEAAAIVQSVEKELAELGVGIEAEVLIAGQHKTKTVKEYLGERPWFSASNTSLAYRRVQAGAKSAFRITVVVEKENVDATPWSECPRDVKLASFPKLPELLEKLIANAMEAKETVEAATATVRKMLSGKD